MILRINNALISSSFATKYFLCAISNILSSYLHFISGKTYISDWCTPQLLYTVSMSILFVLWNSD